MSHLSDYFRCECKCRLLTLAQVARMLGYRNIKKGVRRLRLFEKTGVIKPGLLLKLAEVFGWDWQVIEELVEDDRRDRLANEDFCTTRKTYRL